MIGYYHRPIEDFLRKPPSSYARSAYAVEVNPWVPRGDVEAAIFFRGVIVSAFGQIETDLAFICLRCSRIGTYANLRGEFPHSLDKKLSFLKSAFSDGPLKKHRETALSFLGRVENLKQLRNLAAHARMQVMPEWGVTFHHYPEQWKGGVTSATERLTLEKLEQCAHRCARLSRLLQSLIERLNRTGILPEVQR